MKNLKMVFVAIVVALTTSCASLPTPQEMAIEIEGYELPKYPEEGKAIVYIVRPNGVAPLVGFKVFVDEKTPLMQMGKNGAGKYIYFNIEPGEHTIISKAENTATTIVNAKENDIIFIEQKAKMGLLFARNQIFEIDETKGTYHVKNLKEGKIIRMDVE